MRKIFGKEQLGKMFSEIGSMLQAPMEVYLLGGGAMCFRDQKAATKDLDLVFDNKKDCILFTSALQKLGFVKDTSPTWEYAGMMAEGGIWKDEDDHMFDLFVNKVCDALFLSDAMKARAVLLGKFENLDVKMVSNEDVILFKGITERARDVDDIVLVVRLAKIDWRIILDECIAQSEETVWHGLLYNKLVEMKDKHGVDSPIRRTLLNLDRRALMKEAYSRYLAEGLSRDEALKRFAKLGFTKKEIEKYGI